MICYMTSCRTNPQQIEVMEFEHWLRNTTVVAIIIPYPMAADFLYAYNTMAMMQSVARLVNDI